jgi:hypothetical protein
MAPCCRAPAFASLNGSRPEQLAPVTKEPLSLPPCRPLPNRANFANNRALATSAPPDARTTSCRLSTRPQMSPSPCQSAIATQQHSDSSAHVAFRRQEDWAKSSPWNAATPAQATVKCPEFQSLAPTVTFRFPCLRREINPRQVTNAIFALSFQTDPSSKLHHWQIVATHLKLFVA